MQDEETITPHPDYIKGFNEGYTISKHMKELADSIARTEHASDRFTGFKDGREQYLKELVQEKFRDWNKEETPALEDPAAQKDKAQEKDDLDLEPER